MKLVMTLVVRNEADIVGANLDYHLAQGVDFAIVTDHGSEDGTGEILREYEMLGVVEVIRDERPGHHQSRRVTHMAELARTVHGADWIIHNDADEFWWPQVGSLRDVFAALPDRYGQIVVPRRNFRPLPEPDSAVEQQPFHQRLIYREARAPLLSTLPKVAHRAVAGIVVAPGNHSISPQLPAVPVRGLLEIFHFPMRSFAQFERKVLQTGVGYELVEDRPPSVGSVQLELLEQHRAGRLYAYYRELTLDESSLQAGLDDGTIAIDRRFADFMREAHRPPSKIARPDAPFAEQLLSDLMDALEEVARNREQMEWAQAHARHLRKQADAAQAHSRTLHERVAALQGQLADTTHNLQITGQALDLLRSSKLVRYTAPARGVYYRLAKKLARG